jgi:signal peptidase I
MANSKNYERKSNFRLNVEAMVTAFIMAMLIRSFVITPFKIPTGSMEPTLHGDVKYGDRILVNRFQYYFNPPKRGDIIVFQTRGIEALEQDKDYIKRLVGLPGEALSILNERLHINGKQVEDSELVKNRRYVFRRFSEMRYGDPEHPIVIPKDCYFVMGDNTENSKDSRYFGFVPKKNVKGRAFLIWWPMKRQGSLK